MPKIKAEDAWIAFTPPTRTTYQNLTAGQIVVDIEERAKMHLDLDPSRRLATACKVVTDDDPASPELQVYRAMMRLVNHLGLDFAAVWRAFYSVEGLHEAIPDGGYYNPPKMHWGAT